MTSPAGPVRTRATPSAATAVPARGAAPTTHATDAAPSAGTTAGPRPTGWRLLRSPRLLGAAARDEVRPVLRVGAVVSVLATAWVVGVAVAHGGAFLPALGAMVVAGLVSGPLAVIDARTHRLPDALTLPAVVLAALALGLGAAATGDGASFVRALEGAAASAAVHLVLATLGGLGLGDVKLAVLVALPLAWLGWSVLVAGVALSFVAGGLWSLGLLLARRVGRRSAVAFGPFVLVGAALALVAAG